MKKKLTLFTGCLLSLVLARAQNINRSSFIKDSLNIYINSALTSWRVPGAAVCIIKDGKVVLMNGYGIKELGMMNKVDENTLFMIGGNTETFTATALAMLQATNRLSLNDKVTKYLPEFKLANKTAGQQATIRDLLGHCLGFENLQGSFTFYNTNLSSGQIIEKTATIKAPYPFKTKWGYSYADYTIAGEIIPWVTGKTWDDYLRGAFFAPLSMHNTQALSRDMPLAPNRAVPHTLVDGRLTAIPYARLDAIAPAESISSSINDLSKWVLALLNDGKVGNKQVIPATAIQETQQPSITVGNVRRLNGETDEEQYGLGWFLEDYAGHHVVLNNGRASGYLSSLTLVPQEHLGIIILSNTDQNQLYEALRWEIMDAYFKMPYRNYSELYLKRFRINEAKKQQLDKRLRDSAAFNMEPSMAMSNYTGKYYNDLYGNMTITQGENNNLEMRFEHHPKMYVRLQPLGGNRFYATFSDPVYGKAVFPFMFQNGRIASVRVKIDDVVERGTYDFKKVE